MVQADPQPNPNRSPNLSPNSNSNPDLLPLIDALQGTLGLETLDLAFNRLTDAGVHVLL